MLKRVGLVAVLVVIVAACKSTLPEPSQRSKPKPERQAGGEVAGSNVTKSRPDEKAACPPAPVEVRTEQWEWFQTKLGHLQKANPGLDVREKLQHWFAGRKAGLPELDVSWWYEPFVRDVRSTLVMVERTQNKEMCRERVLGLSLLPNEQGWVEGGTSQWVNCPTAESTTAYDVVYRLLLAIQHEAYLELKEVAPEGGITVRWGKGGGLDLDTCERVGDRLKARNVAIDAPLDWTKLPGLGRAEFIGMDCRQEAEGSACTTRIAQQDVCVHVCLKDNKPKVCAITWADWGH